jgi:hypothetical protein
MLLRQLLSREGRAKVGIALAHDRQSEAANLRWQPVIARFTAPLREQTGGAICLQATQQAENLAPLQADQRAGVLNTKPAGLNAQ